MRKKYKSRGSKKLAYLILPLLEQNRGIVMTAKDIAKALSKYEWPETKNAGGEYSDQPVRTAISKAVSILREDGYPIPDEEYVYPHG